MEQPHIWRAARLLHTVDDSTAAPGQDVDDLEYYLSLLSSSSTERRSKHVIRSLLGAYMLLKKTPGATLLEPVLHYSEYAAEKLDHRDLVLSFDASQSLSGCLAQLSSNSSTHQHGVKICALSFESVSVDHTFSPRQKLFISFLLCQSRRYNPVRDAVAYTLDMPTGWGLSSEVLKDLTATEVISSHEPSLQLPSSGPLPPKNLFGAAGMSVQLCWQHERPSYAGDLDTFISQRHCASPPFEYVNVFYLPTEIVQRRKILLFKNPRLLRRYRALLPRSSLGLSADWCAVLPLLTVYDVIIEDTLEAVRGLRQVLTLMTYKIRRPSRSKAQYLLHLADCQRKAFQDLIAARQFLLEVTKSFAERFGSMSDDDSAKGSINVQPKLADKTLIDLDYLIEALRPPADDVDKLQHSIEKQMNLAQMQRSMILTVLASIFIPLSFTTSYFGMNISTSNNSVSNITFNGNSTASPSIRFQGTQSSNNPVAWEIKYFWIVAIPLIFATIILPLIASPCARWMMKAMDRSHEIYMIAFSILGQLPYHRQWGCVALVVYVVIVYIGFGGMACL
ncbi:MAG: hypothetical protein FRX48_07932 [Lasallia pustulata]|uniref:Mg2+ transporter protein, CorA-like/Zinc transport protein ZntB n=1 Tax=Lasallia pustulata TaxID=136370 RepID=A0A5M8PH04_9LECA|nr:MAG: hypothetical protein FRX48_07932 [Lasallia pustulata]